MPPHDAHSQRLLTFASALPGTEHLYLLLDPLAAYPIEGALSGRHLAERLGTARVYPIPCRRLAHSTAHQPLLCQLAGPGLRLATTALQASVLRACQEQDAQQRYICGWLHSRACIAEVARHISRQADGLPELGGAALPWYEPLRLELLATTLGSSLGGLLGPIQSWWAPSNWGPIAQWAGGGLATEEQCARATQAQALVPLVRRLLDLWRAAQRAPLVHFARPNGNSAALPPNAAREALSLILHAQTLGLHRTQDILALCLGRACVDQRLHEYPGIRLHIDQAARGVHPLPVALARYHGGQWQSLLAELSDTRQGRAFSQTLPTADAVPGRTD